MKYPKIIASTINPEKLSLTAKGLLIGLVPIIILVMKQFGVNLEEMELSELINAGLIAVASVVTFLGLVRKLIAKFEKP